MFFVRCSTLLKVFKKLSLLFPAVMPFTCVMAKSYSLPVLPDRPAFSPLLIMIAVFAVFIICCLGGNIFFGYRDMRRPYPAGSNWYMIFISGVIYFLPYLLLLFTALKPSVLCQLFLFATLLGAGIEAVYFGAKYKEDYKKGFFGYWFASEISVMTAVYGTLLLLRLFAARVFISGTKDIIFLAMAEGLLFVLYSLIRFLHRRKFNAVRLVLLILTLLLTAPAVAYCACSLIKYENANLEKSYAAGRQNNLRRNFKNEAAEHAASVKDDLRRNAPSSEKSWFQGTTE